MSSRDRDASGRPRNARLRDGLGRPLPRSASDGVARVPDEATFTVSEGVAIADRMLREDQPFHAHEVLEALWKTRPSAERELWQGLAQIAVGVTHARRGNARGAITLLRRGADRVAGYSGPSYGIGDVASAARALADRISHDGLDPSEQYLLRLTPRSM
jgi:uncharacterized protein